jgi:hypothetical protein
MDVIIVSKTHMSNAACVGGVLANGRFVRLLNSDGYNQDAETHIEVGDVYTIVFSEREHKTPPHIEDILVNSMTYKFTFFSIDQMVEYLKTKLKVKIWNGSSDVLFDGKLQWTSGGSGYISNSGQIPNNSVGFWIPDKDLKRKDFNEKIRYSYPLRWRNISYVGFQSPVELIPAGTLVRVSLARWWSPNNEEERCYLQLSGWYCLPEASASGNGDNDAENLPW